MMTEREAWTAIADVLEMLEGMPPRHDGTPKPGLCALMWDVYVDGDIDNVVVIQMQDRIYAELDKHPWPKDNAYLFRPGLWKPRAKLARRFAKECGE